MANEKLSRYTCKKTVFSPSGDRDGKTGFRTSDGVLTGRHGSAHDGRFHRASVGPAHGSQPGAQAGRHALEGREFEGSADCANRSPRFALDTVAVGPARNQDISRKRRQPFWRLAERNRARSLPILPILYTGLWSWLTYLHRFVCQIRRNTLLNVDIKYLPKFFFGSLEGSETGRMEEPADRGLRRGPPGVRRTKAHPLDQPFGG